MEIRALVIRLQLLGQLNFVRFKLRSFVNNFMNSAAWNVYFSTSPMKGFRRAALESFPNFFNSSCSNHFFACFFPQHRPSFQQLLLPFCYGMAIRWVLAIFWSKSSLNTHRKLQFSQPITTLNFLSNYELRHFSFHLFLASLNRCVPHTRTSTPYLERFSISRFNV